MHSSSPYSWGGTFCTYQSDITYVMILLYKQSELPTLHYLHHGTQFVQVSWITSFTNNILVHVMSSWLLRSRSFSLRIDFCENLAWGSCQSLQQGCQNSRHHGGVMWRIRTFFPPSLNHAWIWPTSDASGLRPTGISRNRKWSMGCLRVGGALGGLGQVGLSLG